MIDLGHDHVGGRVRTCTAHAPVNNGHLTEQGVLLYCVQNDRSRLTRLDDLDRPFVQYIGVTTGFSFPEYQLTTRIPALGTHTAVPPVIPVSFFSTSQRRA